MEERSIELKAKFDAFTEAVKALGEQHDVHAMVISFALEDSVDGEDMKARTAVIGCPSHCEKIIRRMGDYTGKYLDMLEESVRMGPGPNQKVH